jgi:hypothetical protein
LREVSFRVRLYSGRDWNGKAAGNAHAPPRWEGLPEGRQQSQFMEVEVNSADLQYDSFVAGGGNIWRLAAQVMQAKVVDHVTEGPPRTVLGYDSLYPPPVEGHVLTLLWESFRSDLPFDEFKLRLLLLPLHLGADMSVAQFFQDFFGAPPGSPDAQQKAAPRKAPDARDADGMFPCEKCGKRLKSYQGHPLDCSNPLLEADGTFFQSCFVSPIRLRASWQPGRIDFPRLKEGDFVQLISLIPLR